ncbi:coiled-coil domain-containing protein 47-like isoform X2 [Varroa jacobsoni]|uniref:PAT complex subunit CCDC47 n=1 Tax=Varroa destructor TaxID=109461 RepID=A0A7M7KFP3_VARDE|nr:coiled-coil domain-containing protein 47-like isoform X1 [Varroa destructor]XP_022701323.1 coiled-coil domain-containing protein 47-like isoform X2 [Varroa jacobsoni]
MGFSSSSRGKKVIMRFWLLSALLVLTLVLANGRPQDDQYEGDPPNNEANEFAEFEEFEDDPQEKQQLLQQTSQQQQRAMPKLEQNEVGRRGKEDDAFVEDDEIDNDADFDHFQDSEEFEGHDQSSERPPISQGSVGGANGGRGSDNDLKITSVPLHLRASWQSYYAEMLMCAALVIYFINFLSGRSKNSRLASAWFDKHVTLLEKNFALVGDDGLKEIQSAGLRKESEHCFTLWCSGRQCVEGMLVELRLIKRQCLVGVLGQLMRPTSDQITYKLKLETMDPFVFCMTSKKNASKLTKEMIDVLTFCPDRKGVPDRVFRDLGEFFAVYSEIGDITQSFFQDQKFTQRLSEYKDCIEMLHVSDQWQGQNALRTAEEASQGTLLKKPETERVVILKISVPGKGRTSEDQMEALEGLLGLVLIVADKASRLRLSKEGRAKADKNRQKVEETFLKNTHVQRQELAQQRRDERIRMERERILAEDDPEKQRRLELREQKRLAKKTTPKLKQMKVRAM